MITKLTCFDFDGTLIQTPHPDQKDFWETQTGMKWKKGWWSNVESLNTDIFEQPLIEWTYENFLKECENENNSVFVATGRLTKLRSQVIKVLSKNGINIRNKMGKIGVDQVYCNPGINTLEFKIDLFDELIKRNPTVNEFTMYDDRQEHLPHFVDWAKTKSIQVNIFDSMFQKQIF